MRTYTHIIHSLTTLHATFILIIFIVIEKTEGQRQLHHIYAGERFGVSRYFHGFYSSSIIIIRVTNVIYW